MRKFRRKPRIARIPFTGAIALALSITAAFAHAGNAAEIRRAPPTTSKANTGSWALDGNSNVPAGAFIGYADSFVLQALELRARNTRVAAFIPTGTAANFGDAPQVLLGSSANVAGFFGATVGGGGSTRVGGAACPTCANRAEAEFATVSGGRGNVVMGNGYGTIAGGLWNDTSASSSTVSGGAYNSAYGANSTVSGGGLNTATDYYTTIAGGQANEASNTGASISGGFLNVAAGVMSIVAGGRNNEAVGGAAIAAGGEDNCAGGDRSFAAGSNAKVRHGNGIEDRSCVLVPNSTDFNGDEGTFVWSDFQGDNFVSTGPNQFLIRAAGGLGLNTATMGAATNLGSGEIVVKNSSGGPNTDVVLLNSTNRGFSMVSEPGTSGNAGRFYITEIDARNAAVAFNPRLRINVDGTTSVVGGAVTNISDARVKKNIAAIDAPLETLLALRGHTFEYIDPAATMNPPGTRIGFVAQEVREVLPQWIADVGDGYLGVQTSGFEALAVEAIRDLKSDADRQIGALRRDNAALQSQNATLRADVDALLERLSRLESLRGRLTDASPNPMSRADAGAVGGERSRR